jgi:hypothetical protein
VAIGCERRIGAHELEATYAQVFADPGDQLAAGLLDGLAGAEPGREQRFQVGRLVLERGPRYLGRE